MKRLAGFAVVVALLTVSCASSDSLGEQSESFWGPATVDETRDAELLQQVYRRGGDREFPPIDPGARCPPVVVDEYGSVAVYRVRRGCLWVRRIEHNEAWRLDNRQLDFERYYTSDPFIVAVHDGLPATDEAVPTYYLAIDENEVPACFRVTDSYSSDGNIDAWEMLEAMYRDPSVVGVPYFPKFPWYSEVEECPTSN